MRVWLIAAIIIPLMIIFFFSLATEEISIDKVVINRWISRKSTEKKGDLIFVNLMIRNNGDRIPEFEIVDTVPDECTVHEGSNHWLLELDKDEKITLSYAIRCHKRGRYLLGPIITRGSDKFHFHSKIKKHAIISSFAVIPPLIKLKDLPIHRQRLLPEVGIIPSLLYKGRDFDFQGVRDYQEGDEVRAINWRVTARFNKLSTNEFAFDQTARIFVIFDHTASTERFLEEGVMAALSTSELLISRRNKVGYFGIGEIVEEIPPAPGKRQLLRINELLIDTKALDPPFDEILDLRIQKRIIPSLPPFAQIFFISPIYNRVILNFLRQLVERGHNVVLLFPHLDDEQESLAHIQNVLQQLYDRDRIQNASQIANGLLLLDRTFVSKQIAKMGIIPFYWYPEGPKYEVIDVRRAR